jgi:hypothetical protein
MRIGATLFVVALAACGGRVSGQGLDGGPKESGAGSGDESGAGGADTGITCTPPTAQGGSGGTGENFVSYGETCSDGRTYGATVTCPYGECRCSGDGATVPYDCDSGASGAFAVCGYPQ